MHELVIPYRERLDKIFYTLGWSKYWFEIALASSVFLFLSSALIFSQLPGIWLYLGFLLSFVPIILAYSIPFYFYQRRIRAIEEELPDKLFQAASLSSFMPFEDIIEELGKDKGMLSKEFEYASRQIRSGSSVEDALNALVKRNDSEVLKRAIDLILQGYVTGADISIALKEVAEDINETADVIRERSVSATVEKSTLLLAGGIIVPIILGTLVSMVKSFDFSGFEMLGIGMDASSRALIINNSILANQIYLAEYALLASIFVAYQENAIERSLIYAGILIPLSLFLFFLSQNMNVLGLF